jgi:hypothetical protein
MLVGVPLEKRLPSYVATVRGAQFWGECRRGKRATLVKRGATILYMLVRLGRGALLRTYHTMGLRQTEGLPRDARLSSQGADMF